ncbi:MAG: pyridoxamine 5'-phosphate oxidase family protein [Spirochaetales bacterium]|nr:pyridoxamine 5'-phosphate oxidase family protein [Spirochaetales bacterium]
MTKHDVMSKIGTLLGEVKTAVLATSDKDGNPHVRWMCPCIFSNRENTLYALSSPHFAKIMQLKENPRVEWMIQSKSLDEIVTLRGKVNIIENPSLKGEVMALVGKTLHVFWTLTGKATDYLVLETIITDAVYFRPMTGQKTAISF